MLEGPSRPSYGQSHRNGPFTVSPYSSSNPHIRTQYILHCIKFMPGQCRPLTLWAPVSLILAGFLTANYRPSTSLQLSSLSTTTAPLIGAPQAPQMQRKTLAHKAAGELASPTYLADKRFCCHIDDRQRFYIARCGCERTPNTRNA